MDKRLHCTDCTPLYLRLVSLFSYRAHPDQARRSIRCSDSKLQHPKVS